MRPNTRILPPEKLPVTEHDLKERFKAARAPRKPGYELCRSCGVEVQTEHLDAHYRAKHGLEPTA